MRYLPFAFASRVPLAVLAALVVIGAADAKTLRWANRGDMQTTDPHSQNEILTNNVNSLIYEFLVDRDRKLDIRPALAESWQKVNDTTWRVKLRQGVKFHDGTPFTADDVVFSYERASGDTSQLRVYANRAGVPRKIDDFNVEFVTPARSLARHVVSSTRCHDSASDGRMPSFLSRSTRNS